MKSFDTYQEAEDHLINEIINNPDFITKSCNEIIGTGFILHSPLNNRNDHSNYDYADKFFEWVLSGEKQLTQELIDSNPWVERFVDPTSLPDSFSASYGWKIKEQLPKIMDELSGGEIAIDSRFSESSADDILKKLISKDLTKE